MKTLLTGSLLALALGCGCAATAAPLYTIKTLGFTDTEHTRTDGYNVSGAYYLNDAGNVTGASQRYNGGNIDLGLSAWLYDGTTTLDIGLIGSEHTRTDDYKYSYAISLNEAGQVVGSSQRYNGGNTYLGLSAWLYDGTSTINVGLTGTEHTNTDGYKYSVIGSLNEAGQVTGQSYRYNGGNIDLGSSAWLYDGTSTLDIGLTGTEHTNADGYKSSYVYSLNEAEQVVGGSARYNGNTNLGQSVWLYDGTSTFDVGLTGIEHTRTDGYKSSYVNRLNEAGQVVGFSARYNGNTNLGQSAWLYDGTSTITLGLTGTEHTRTNGFKESGANYLNATGQVAGYSARFIGSSEFGLSAWLYDGNATIQIGLTDTEHTYADGHNYSYVTSLNEAGQVVGYASRSNGGYDNLGQSAWLYDGISTLQIGLTGTEHTRTDEYKYSLINSLNEAGQVAGTSERYNGGNDNLGESAWLYDGNATIQIGLTSSEHTNTDGYKISVIDSLNEAGQVAGYSERYQGLHPFGHDAWLYDPVLDQTFSMQLSVRSSDGYAYSSINYLGEDGLVLGYYLLFDAFDILLGNRAFYFTTEDGLHDLGLLVDGGLAANDWEYLANSVRGNSLGQIIGSGRILGGNGNQMGYLMTPIQEPVPEPASIALLGLAGLAGLVASRRRYLFICTTSS